MYVSERSADSICDTELAFLVTKSPYFVIHFGGNASASGTRFDTCSYISISEQLSYGTCAGGLGLLLMLARRCRKPRGLVICRVTSRHRSFSGLIWKEPRFVELVNLRKA